MRNSLFVLVVITSACTTTRSVRHHIEPRSGERATLILRDTPTSDRVSVRATEVPGVGVRWTTTAGAAIEPEHIAEVRRVVATRRFRGAVEGTLIGAGSGFVVGMLVGLAQGDDPPCEPLTDCSWFGLTAEERGTLLGLGFAMLGGVAGATIGAVVGHKVVEVSSGLETPRVTVTPTSGGVVAQAGWSF